MNAILVVGPDGEYFAKFEVGQGDGMAPAARLGVLDAREAKREVSPLDRLIDVGPLHLDEAGRPPTAESTGDAVGNLHVETAHARRIGGIGFDKRGPAH